jgi:transcriptional regulator with XRE-family HTH domain
MSWDVLGKNSPLSSERQKEIRLLMKLVNYRKEHNVSQEALAAKLGMNQSQLIKIEIGEKIPKLGTILQIADGLDLELALISKDTHEKICNFDQ